MSYKIIILPKAEREIKRLSKKYRSFKADLAGLISSFEQQPQQGESLGRDCFKIRLAISAKNRGKSGGARVITYAKIVEQTVVILSVYDKSETDSISDDEIDDRLTSANI